MRAIVLTRYGGPEVLSISRAPDPEPGPDEVLVRVRATAVNRADTLQRQGRYPPPDPQPAHEIPGLEFAGEVVAVGARARRHHPGDRVCGLLPGGGYAELVTTHERMAMAIPDRWSFEEAAAVPEVFFTAYDALFRQAGLQAGEAMLVHAAGSGVGTAAIQLAVAAGATAYGTARSEEKCRRAMALGAAVCVDMREEETDFAATIVAANSGRPIDVVLDLVGAAYLPRSLAALGPHGRIVFIGTVGGSRAELDMGLVMRHRLHLTGSTLRARAPEEKMALTAEFERRVLPQFAAGRLRPVVDRVLPWTEAAEAHRLVEAGALVGKVVLRVEGAG